MKSTIFNPKLLLKLSAFCLVGGASLVSAPTAWAGSYFNLDFETAPDGTLLDAFEIDGDGQEVGSTKYSTSLGNVGLIWENLGITITGYNNNYVNDYLNPNKNPKKGGRRLGLFQSNCLPSQNGVYEDGASVDGYTEAGNGLCAVNHTLGDNDLATGEYLNASGAVLYDSDPLGNLLIFEENKGNGRPDDTAKGGTFVFEFDQFNYMDATWAIDEISVVDDAKGIITYFYTDGTMSSEDIDIEGENEVMYFNQAEYKQISKLAVQFRQSGGIGGVSLRKIPEPATVAGLIAVGTGVVLKRRNKSQQA